MNTSWKIIDWKLDCLWQEIFSNNAFSILSFCYSFMFQNHKTSATYYLSEIFPKGVLLLCRIVFSPCFWFSRVQGLLAGEFVWKALSTPALPLPHTLRVSVYFFASLDFLPLCSPLLPSYSPFGGWHNNKTRDNVRTCGNVC